MVIPSIAGDPCLNELIGRLATGEGTVHASGLWGSSAPMLAALIARQLPHTILYIRANPEEADNTVGDIELFLGETCRLLPAWEAMPGEGTARGEIQAERLRLCADLLNENRHEPRAGAQVIVAPILALMQPVPTASALGAHTIQLVADRIPVDGVPPSPESLTAWAIDRGFERLDMVETPGDVARRGDIVDLFVPGETNPYRIQFFDNVVESIRRFDVSSQRSIESLTSVTICAMPEGANLSETEQTHLFDYLPDDAIVIIDQPTGIQELGQTLIARLGGADRLFNVSDVLIEVGRFLQLHLSTFGSAAISGESTFDLGAQSLARFEGDPPEAIAELVAQADDHQIHVLCDNEGERKRLREMLQEHAPDIADTIQLSLGVISRGFKWSATKTIVVAHHEIFRRQRQRRPIRRVYAGRPVETWTDLVPGELVVHVSHGIARYRGLTKLQKGESGRHEEFLTLEFAGGAVVHVPATQIDLVQKYIGSAGHRPQLSTLGGKRWNKTKEQVAEAVSELAERLIRIQATRAQATGTAYPEDTEWQREFEASFLYEETEDQLSVAADISGDLRKARPMDRLVCGDVGYGKTELAMRAAFKVVEYGRQVAVLVPTTVLAEQHYETFSERMAPFPFTIGCLSRFRGASEKRKLIEQLKKGQLDIVIGTHRLISKDVSFADLGLVIIDEEQRFGVAHKERLKSMRETVDVLTLTATPIPRTLHMSMVGLRDISSLQTPPVDRRSIATQVRQFDRALIRDAILRELNRDGQVYFIHNFVQSISAMADTIRSIVPDARVIYGHGQMKDRELEAVMHRFARREADVLVATTIIESGIDNPNVNTIFINRAERFGLADLHQLRGRVGRSSHRAYCYLLLSPEHQPIGNAAKRLKTIEEFSELGAGFRIAMRDLEIRGAGNLLGSQQSGHIASVGYEMYCRLLDQTVRRLKKEPDPSPTPVPLDLDVAAHIPPHYIAADRSRIEIYRRIVSCRIAADLAQLEKDLVDTFGPIPKPLQVLIELAELRVYARQFEIASISLRPPDVIFRVNHLPTAQRVFVDAPGTVRMPDSETIHLRLPPRYLEPGTLVPILRRMMLRATKQTEATA